MRLSELGERKLVELIREWWKGDGRLEVGIGDDAAVLRLGEEHLVLTTDILFQHSHFPLGATPEQMGWKAAAVNLSDLAAMGAEPLALLFSLALPSETDLRVFRKIMNGMERAAKRYGAALAGGDLSEDEEIAIAGFAVGRAGRILRRSGAKVGDLLAVTNRLGRASAGLHLLTHSLRSRSYYELVKAQLEPEPRIREGQILAAGGATSAIDLSDGLASNLWQLALESGVRMVLERVPTHPLVERFARENGLDPLEFSLFGGEDYELLFTLPPEKVEEMGRNLKKVGSELTVIGRVEKGKGVVREVEGRPVPVPNRGYEHFRGTEDGRAAEGGKGGP
jgi:thiamine-monophosphate kinase